eukprot:scaffold43909_cov58-Phaeocystis_antarctica.AAC.2
MVVAEAAQMVVAPGGRTCGTGSRWGSREATGGRACARGGRTSSADAGEGTPKAPRDLVLFRGKTAAAKPWPRPDEWAR